MALNDTADVVVDTRDSRTLAGLLTEIDGVTITTDESDARLGLTRWHVSGVGAAVLAMHPRPPTAMTSTAGSPGADDPPDQADLLVTGIRQAAQERYGRWYPTIDRDHDEQVITNPVVKIALGNPVPVPAPGQTDPPTAPDGPRVGIADAQIYAHQDLAGRYIGQPLTGPGPFTTAAPGHATFVAGTVLRRAPSAQLVCVTALGHNEANTSWQVATRLMSFLAEEVDVLNMSIGCVVDAEPPLALRRAIDRLAGRTVLVAAVGNQDANTRGEPMYPAAFGDVVAVGAAGPDGLPAAFTPPVPWMDLLAPGVDIVGPFVTGAVFLDGERTPVSFDSGYARWQGSSFAAAAVTGAIARRMQEHHVDAFTARDELLAQGDGDITPLTLDLNVVTTVH
jgi:membrane-anchored mycosin MYCP